MKISIILFITIIYSTAYSQSEDFSTFANQFYGDSTFQMERIKFPILSITYNLNMDRDDSSSIEKKDWLYSDHNYRQNSFRTQVYDNFKMKMRNTGERVVHYEGIENGINYSMYFKLVGRKWYLVKIIDRGT